MVQAGDGLCLAPKSGLDHRIARHFGSQELDGNLPAQNLVDSQMDVGHSSAADELTNNVATVENAFPGHCLFTIVI
ncbi:hypothetical protein GCM10009628_39340 [Paeniglutamicibacter kerguelensis]